MNIRITFDFGFNIFFSFILVLLSLNIFSCNTKTVYTDNNPENFIAKQINERKIVILGEQPHRHPGGYNEIIKILYEWLSECKRTNNKLVTLNLVTEYDEFWTNDVNDYISTANSSQLIDNNIHFITFEEIEFISKLKTFNDSIKFINNENSGYNLKFKVLGYEEPSNFFTNEGYKRNIYEEQYWFIKERDSVVVQKFMDYYNKNLNDKYLFYYGQFHLQKSRVNKKLPDFIISDDSCYGYCLAGYLKSYLGNENVITINKQTGIKSDFNRIGFDTSFDKKILIKAEAIKFKNEYYNQFDYVFLNVFPESYDHSFNFVYSKRIIEKKIEKLTEIDKSKPGTLGDNFRKRIMEKISYAVGTNFTDTKQLKIWFDKQKSFDLSHFDSKEYRDNLFNIYTNNEDDAATNNLKNLGYEKNTDEYRFIDTVIWNNKIWPEALKDIKFINAIGIFWAGYPDEKIKAKEFLKNFSGEDYAEPDKYLQWWRNVYHNYGI